MFRINGKKTHNTHCFVPQFGVGGGGHRPPPPPKKNTHQYMTTMNILYKQMCFEIIPSQLCCTLIILCTILLHTENKCFIICQQTLFIINTIYQYTTYCVVLDILNSVPVQTVQYLIDGGRVRSGESPQQEPGSRTRHDDVTECGEIGHGSSRRFRPSPHALAEVPAHFQRTSILLINTEVLLLIISYEDTVFCHS